MIFGKKILAIVPARSGSKGLPGKNLRDLHGKPMIDWTLQAAKSSKYIDKIILSTDDAAIAARGPANGIAVPYMRPSILAQDQSTSAEVVEHVLQNETGFDFLLLLQPTSPVRSANHIDAALEKMAKVGASGICSVKESPAHPAWIYFTDSNGAMVPSIQNSQWAHLPRQQLPQAFVLNGAIYCVQVKYFLKEKSFVAPGTLPYLMSDADSVDVDTLEDFEQAQMQLRKGP